MNSSSIAGTLYNSNPISNKEFIPERKTAAPFLSVFYVKKFHLILLRSNPEESSAEFSFDWFTLPVQALRYAFNTLSCHW